MANTSWSEVDRLRASILAQVIRRDILEQMLEKARLMESAHGKDYPRNLSQAFQDLMDTKSHKPE
ncbi:MAG TPA: hypothetical protein VMT42_05105 [candidate division Zixibacteria bacterium]|nr:hypothetical protein [candidate division Zixibacteria bacterium]